MKGVKSVAEVGGGGGGGDGRLEATGLEFGLGFEGRAAGWEGEGEEPEPEPRTWDVPLKEEAAVPDPEEVTFFMNSFILSFIMEREPAAAEEAWAAASRGDWDWGRGRAHAE